MSGEESKAEVQSLRELRKHAAKELRELSLQCDRAIRFALGATASPRSVAGRHFRTRLHELADRLSGVVEDENAEWFEAMGTFALLLKVSVVETLKDLGALRSRPKCEAPEPKGEGEQK